METTGQGPVLFFDGVCNLCNRAVQYVIRHDRKKQFRFASLQSPAGEALRRELLASEGAVPDSLLLQYRGKVYRESDAALHTARLLGGIPALAALGFVFPRFVRDAVYRLVARNRYRWFGRRDECMLPTPELQSRFL